MTYKPPHPERVPDGGRRAHKVEIRVGNSIIVGRGDCAPLGGAFDDRTREYGEPTPEKEPSDGPAADPQS
jgi:hypothetical protein